MKSLKVLMLNGSPHANGNTAVALREMEAIFKENDVDVETVVLGNRDIRGCVACGSCAKTGKCVFDDGVKSPRNTRKREDKSPPFSGMQFVTAGSSTGFSPRRCTAPQSGSDFRSNDPLCRPLR